jgi:hypothetical protein
MNVNNIIKITVNQNDYFEKNSAFILRIGLYDFNEETFLLYNKSKKVFVLGLYELLIENRFIYQGEICSKYKGTKLDFVYYV